MSIDEARSEVGSFEIDHVMGLVFSHPNHASIFNRNVRGINLAAENVDEIGIFEKHFSRLFTAGNAEFLLDVTHSACQEYLPSRQRNSHCRLPGVITHLSCAWPFAWSSLVLVVIFVIDPTDDLGIASRVDAASQCISIPIFSSSILARTTKLARPRKVYMNSTTPCSLRSLLCRVFAMLCKRCSASSVVID